MPSAFACKHMDIALDLLAELLMTTCVLQVVTGRFRLGVAYLPQDGPRKGDAAFHHYAKPPVASRWQQQPVHFMQRDLQHHIPDRSAADSPMQINLLYSFTKMQFDVLISGMPEEGRACTAGTG